MNYLIIIIFILFICFIPISVLVSFILIKSIVKFSQDRDNLLAKKSLKKLILVFVIFLIITFIFYYLLYEIYTNNFNN